MTDDQFVKNIHRVGHLRQVSGSKDVSMADIQPGLVGLLHPMDVVTFLRDYWPDRHLARCGTSWSDIINIPELYDAEPLLNGWSEEVCVVLDPKEDPYARYTVKGPLALRLHRQGITVALTDVETAFPELRTWLDRIHFDLGLPQNSRRHAEVYVSARGQRTSNHFDAADVNLVLQLTGHKRWWVAPNMVAPFPTKDYRPWAPGLHAEVLGYANGTLSSAIPEDATVVDLRPGSLLFVPPGTWHATEALEDSISLSFFFRPPTWADLVCRRLRHILIQDVAWRKPVQGAATLNEARYESGDAALAALLPSLRTVVERVSVADFAERALGCSQHARFRFDNSRVLVDTFEQDATFDCSQADVRLLAWIASRTEPFTPSDMAMRGHDWESALSLIASLIDMGVLYIR